MSTDHSQQLLHRAADLRRAGRVAEAIEAYEQLLTLRPDLADSWYNLAWLQRQAGDFPKALAAYEKALENGVSGPEEVFLNRAVILSDHLGRSDEAAAELKVALAYNPNYVPALLNLGNLAEDRGLREQARAAYERALAIEPGSALALARLAGVVETGSADDPIVEHLRAALAQPGLADIDRADLGFALGRLLDAAGAYDNAFAAYAAANQAARASFGPAFSGYDRAGQERLVDRLIAAFPEPVQARGGLPPSPEVVFICGLFRSGSTLAERILARHPKVAAGGELDLIPALIETELQPYPEAAKTADADRLAESYLDGVRARIPWVSVVTDKRPDNFLHIGLIKTMFPEARIVHTVRNPLDNLLSLYFLHLDPGMAYALDLEDAAHWHGQYRRLMAHWKRLYPDDIFDLDYDRLVAGPRPEIEALLAFCGLAWDEACLAPHEADAVVKTASTWQVREPLYSRASGRWRHYARHLERIRGMVEGD